MDDDDEDAVEESARGSSRSRVAVTDIIRLQAWDTFLGIVLPSQTQRRSTLHRWIITQCQRSLYAEQCPHYLLGKMDRNFLWS